MLPERHSILNLLEGGFGQLKILVIGDVELPAQLLQGAHEHGGRADAQIAQRAR